MNSMDLELRILQKQRSIIKILNRYERNIIKTEKLFLKADKILQNLQKSLNDFSSNEDIDDENYDIRNPTADNNDLSRLGAHAVEDSHQLKIEDRIVWLIRDDDPVIGTVKWIGWMVDGLAAGIEFDDAIGNTNGELDGNVIFKCKPRHGRFVLVKELILWKDFVEL